MQVNGKPITEEDLTTLLKSNAKRDKAAKANLVSLKNKLARPAVMVSSTVAGTTGTQARQLFRSFVEAGDPATLTDVAAMSNKKLNANGLTSYVSTRRPLDESLPSSVTRKVTKLSDADMKAYLDPENQKRLATNNEGLTDKIILLKHASTVPETGEIITLDQIS